MSRGSSPGAMITPSKGAAHHGATPSAVTYAGVDALHDVEVTPPLWAFHQLWRDLVTGSARRAGGAW